MQLKYKIALWILSICLLGTIVIGVISTYERILQEQKEKLIDKSCEMFDTLKGRFMYIISIEGDYDSASYYRGRLQENLEMRRYIVDHMK